MSEENYVPVTYGITVAAATILARLNPQVTFDAETPRRRENPAERNKDQNLESAEASETAGKSEFDLFPECRRMAVDLGADLCRSKNSCQNDTNFTT